MSVKLEQRFVISVRLILSPKWNRKRREIKNKKKEKKEEKKRKEERKIITKIRGSSCDNSVSRFRSFFILLRAHEFFMDFQREIENSCHVKISAVPLFESKI